MPLKRALAAIEDLIAAEMGAARPLTEAMIIIVHMRTLHGKTCTLEVARDGLERGASLHLHDEGSNAGYLKVEIHLDGEVEGKRICPVDPR